MSEAKYEVDGGSPRTAREMTAGNLVNRSPQMGTGWAVLALADAVHRLADVLRDR